VSDLGFDSATHYQFLSFTRKEKDQMDYGEVLSEFVAPQYEKAVAECAAPYIPHVSVGWDNNVRYEKFQPPVYTNNRPARLGAGRSDMRSFIITYEIVF
jgi:hypothetical protein